MIDIRVKYQTSVFVDAIDIAPRPDIIMGLIDEFRDREFLPSTFYEIKGSPVPKPRIQLSTGTGEWVIRIASERIDVEKVPTDPGGTNLGDLAGFCAEASGFVGRILNRHPREAKRLALITILLAREMSGAALDAVYLKLFRPPPFYTENVPFEWDWRCAAAISLEIGALRENVNAITTMKRVGGQLTTGQSVVPIDRIQFAFDINTVAEARQPRFEMAQIRDYFSVVSALHDDLLREMQEFIDVP